MNSLGKILIAGTAMFALLGGCGDNSRTKALEKINRMIDSSKMTMDDVVTAASKQYAKGYEVNINTNYAKNVQIPYDFTKTGSAKPKFYSLKVLAGDEPKTVISPVTKEEEIFIDRIIYLGKTRSKIEKNMSVYCISSKKGKDILDDKQAEIARKSIVSDAEKILDSVRVYLDDKETNEKVANSYNVLDDYRFQAASLIEQFGGNQKE